MEHLFLHNHLLIANPSLQDSVFSGAVMLICEHNKKGALGIILNRPTDIKLEEIFNQLSIDSNQLLDKKKAVIHNIDQLKKFVHFGGPINSERGLVLHEKMGDWQYSIKVNNYINLTTSQDIMHAIASGSGPKRNVFVLGYASWEPGQLESEIIDNSWLTMSLDYSKNKNKEYQKHNKFQTEFSLVFDLIFSTPAELQWRKSLELLGIDPEKLSDDYGHA